MGIAGADREGLLDVYGGKKEAFTGTFESVDGGLGKVQADKLSSDSLFFERECQDFCVWGGYSRGSPTRLPFVFEMQYARPDAIAGAKVEGPARSAGGSSLAPAIARREAAGALAREV